MAGNLKLITAGVLQKNFPHKIRKMRSRNVLMEKVRRWAVVHGFLPFIIIISPYSHIMGGGLEKERKSGTG